jgi:hypothetical protein
VKGQEKMKSIWGSKRAILTMLLFALLLGAVTLYVLFVTSKDSQATIYETLGVQTGLDVYYTDETTNYQLIDASAEQGNIIISTYQSNKGLINVTQQVRPSTDPFRGIEAADSFTTSIGDGRIYPDNNDNPYVVIDTPLTWIIIRSTSEQITSADLKKFSLSLEAAPL